MTKPTGPALMEKITSLCKRRGFIFQASEIYGGINGFWDYGPLGVLLKNNLRDAWWKDMVLCPPIGPDGEPLQIVGLDSAIIQNPRTWVASGHVGGFSDPMVDCRETKNRYRADHLLVFTFPTKDADRPVRLAILAGDDALERLQSRIKKLSRKLAFDVSASPAPQPYSALSTELRSTVIGPDTDLPGSLTEPRQFNLMFESHAGPIKDEENKVYLRPETAQGIFLNYKNVLDTTRVKLPFGIAQVGKSFRNEINPRNYIFRSREFEQMELEFFCPPDQSDRWYAFWRDSRLKWWESVGVTSSRLRLREHDPDELSHYSSSTADVEYMYPFTEPDFGELEGVANRGCYDLTQHQKHSTAKLDYFDQDRAEAMRAAGAQKADIDQACRYIPHVIEPAAGLTRGVLVLLCEAYDVDESRPSPEIMRFRPAMAPIKAGIFPLVNKDGMPETALRLYQDLRRTWTCEYDPKQAIGRRYARMDEAGTPFCFTIDGQTADDQTITVRDRDDGRQERIHIDNARSFLHDQIPT